MAQSLRAFIYFKQNSAYETRLSCWSSDVCSSDLFYRSLGFELLRRTGGFAVIHWDGQRLFLAEDPDAPTAPRWVNIRIMVDDVDALWEHVQALGISPAHAIGDRFYGLRDFKLSDPSGFEIRFAQAAT